MIPHDDRFDSSFAFFRDPYRYVSRRCEALGSDAFAARLLLRPTICFRGAGAARLFYDESRFVRRGAAPGALRKTLIGDGGVQGLDDEAHRGRKAILIALTAPERVEALVRAFLNEWDAAVPAWANAGEVVLYEALHPLIARAVCRWAGVPLAPEDVPRRTRQLRALFDHAASKGPKHFGARIARRKSERWLAALIEGVRRNEIAADPAGPLGVIAGHREADGTLLAPRIAAVELLNLLRPTVAVAVYITFIAHALTRHPDARDAVAAGGEVEAGDFLQEVRRYYPFFPAQVALVRRSFEYRGHVLQAGSQALLDLYGTSHHPDLWSEPDRFRPDRFRNWSDDGFSLIPQGGGDAATGHRCPGEGIALALMNAALDRLTRGMTYDVPAQELELDFSRLPALPRSRLVISRVSPDRIARR